MSEAKKNDSRVLLVLASLYAVLQGISILLYWVLLDSFELATLGKSVLCVAVAFLLYSSYRSHTKNVMKPLIGAMLSLTLLNDLDACFTYFSYRGQLPELFPGGNIGLLLIIAAALFLLSLLINIMHYVINMTHHSSPEKIKVNKLLYTLYVILSLGFVAFCILFMSPAEMKITYAFNHIPRIFRILMIIFIESKLDDFRILRETVA